MSNALLKEELTKKIGEHFIDLTDKKTFETELSFAVQHINKNPQLKNATFESNMIAVMNIAQTGLTLNPVLKLAYLVPRTAKKDGQWVIETHLEPSYMGLCKLVTDTGSAKNIYAHPVYDGDEFEVSLGTSTQIIHKPKYKSKEITHVYCVSVLSDGSKMIEVMTSDDIKDIKERSESFKAYQLKKIPSCVWVSDYSEMARKTVIRRAIKYLPKTDMWDKLSQAIHLDEQDYKPSDGQIQYIENLLLSANIQPEEQSSLFNELNTMSRERASEVIQYLQDNQVDPISAGHNYNMTDIKKKINSEI